MKRNYIIVFFFLFLIHSYGQESSTLSPSEKIYGLSKFWQEVNYNFANFDHVPDLNWDSAYMAYIPKVLEAKTDFDYYHLLIRFAALLKDGHTRVWFPNNIHLRMSNTMFGDYQFYIENIDNKAIIVRVNASKIKEIPIGSEIIEVNGKPTEKYLNDECIPYTHASTDYIRRDWAVSAMLWGFFGENFDVKIKTPAGEIKSFSLIINKSEEKELIPPEISKDLLTFKWFDGHIAYLELNSFSDPKIDTLFKEKLPELREAKKLIIDVRDNDGGNTNIGAYIAQYFIEDTLFYASKVKIRKNLADRRTFGGRFSPKDTINNPFTAEAYNCFHNQLWDERGIGQWRNNISEKDRIIIPTVILMGHETGSAAESFLLFFDKSKHILKIGQNSNGSTGNQYVFELPGGGLGAICTSHCTYPDGRLFVGYGIKPDIEINRKISEVINNIDNVLDEAVKYLLSKK